MKIYKRPANLLFDTDNTDVILPEFIPILEVVKFPLIHETTKLMTVDYLKKFFEKSQKRSHMIFENLGESYYYLVN
ncbi:hypothetical protein [Tenacibaculum finnmarkense]|uniref:hypothetical protein n=1 Tax=Tenacibaculum finnmarkense TaxID=2781243 RepID=UPI00187B3CB5|nr:hypothetical protein [Tenacibaculum finnmarkense]MBE7649248.1 hypothetical protein [Tenacibaculum finnmarkense genomovar ulcerans]